ncbi:MAG: bacterial/archaeal transporter family-2 protein [Acidobacteriaceae bacterium]|jgi:transporter family-2 protein|nr:bacterial/archaeal transporter family-2 protein [Acidobacteriaceae bacterium]MEA2261397.1 bacterial/archaeal transporter family-2 protein [Acidobacteriaceae bacterium]
MNAGWIIPFIILGGALQSWVTKVGAGLFVGFAVTAALLMSLAIDHFGWFGMDLHPLNTWRSLGGLLLVAGVTLIAKY